MRPKNSTSTAGKRKTDRCAYVDKDDQSAESKNDDNQASASITNGAACNNNSSSRRVTRYGGKHQDRHVDIGANNTRRWQQLKDLYGFIKDSDFVTYLLDGLTKQTESKLGMISKTTSLADGGGGLFVDILASDEAEAKEDAKEEIAGEATRDTRLSEYSDSEMMACEDYEDQSDDSNDRMSDDKQDAEWTPASYMCVTEFANHSLKENAECKKPMKHKRKSGSPRKSKKKRVNVGTVAETPGEKTIKQRRLTCIYCNVKHIDIECPLNRPLSSVADNVGSRNDSCDSLARISLPSVVKLSTVDADHGPGLIAVDKILKYTRFGPLIGDHINEMDIGESVDLKDIWEIFGSYFKLYVNTSNERNSNWLRYMRPAASKSEQNVAVIAKEEKLYFITTEDVEVGVELLYWVDDPTWSWSKMAPVNSTCPTCDKKIDHLLYYRMHCVIFHNPHAGHRLKKFRCKVCGIAVLGKEALTLHAAEMHGGKGAYQCEYCKRFMLRLPSLEAHQTYSCKMNPLRHRPLCELCGKEFSFPQKLKVHMRRMHSDNSEILAEFQCKLCSKLMSSPTCLQRHMNEVHAMNEASTCDRCGKTFQNKSNLKIHMLTHSGVKPFRCIDCTSAFTTKQCLQFHYKKCHNYTENNMPVIERCVAYTFENYAGGGAGGVNDVGAAKSLPKAEINYYGI